MMKKNKILKFLGNLFRLDDERIIRFLPFAAYVVFLGAISIYISHRADTKVRLINTLSEQRQALEAEHTEAREKLTKLSLESRITRKAKDLGLTEPEERPEKIVIQ